VRHARKARKEKTETKHFSVRGYSIEREKGTEHFEELSAKCSNHSLQEKKKGLGGRLPIERERKTKKSKKASQSSHPPVDGSCRKKRAISIEKNLKGSGVVVERIVKTYSQWEVALKREKTGEFGNLLVTHEGRSWKLKGRTCLDAFTRKACRKVEGPTKKKREQRAFTFWSERKSVEKEVQKEYSCTPEGTSSSKASG